MNLVQSILERFADRRLAEGGGNSLPNPAASEEEILSLERSLGMPVPEQLRSLLSFGNGWSRFFLTIDLLSTYQMVDSPQIREGRMYLEVARDVFGPVADGVSLEAPIIFGVSTQQGDLLLLNPLKVSSTGELEVVWWYNEVVERRDSMAEFLDLLYRLDRS